MSLIKASDVIDTDSKVFVDWFERVKDMIQTFRDTHYKNLPPCNFEIKQGRKFIKIISDNSVYAFINRYNGDVMKPASWSAPAKHARGNIKDESGFTCCGPHSVAYLK